MASLLVVSLLLAFLGYIWVVGVLLWQYPWLLQVLLFTSVATLLFGGSFLCLIFYLIRMRHEQGLMQLLPPAAAEVLDLSIFEIVEVVNRQVMRPLYDAIRVLLLINADLDEKTRREILEEMSPEFRRRVFQCSLAQLLPTPIQKVALGKDFKASTIKASMHDLFGDRQDWKLEKTDKTEIGDISPVKRSRSLTELLDFMRSVEGASQKTRQSSVLQKILASSLFRGCLIMHVTCMSRGRQAKARSPMGLCGPCPRVQFTSTRAT